MCVATSVDIERVFSHGRVLLGHVRNRLTTQSTWAILCLSAWSLGGLAKDCDVMNIARLMAMKRWSSRMVGMLLMTTQVIY